MGDKFIFATDYSSEMFALICMMFFEIHWGLKIFSSEIVRKAKQG